MTGRTCELPVWKARLALEPPGKKHTTESHGRTDWYGRADIARCWIAGRGTARRGVGGVLASAMDMGVAATAAPHLAHRPALHTDSLRRRARVDLRRDPPSPVHRAARAGDPSVAAG